MLKQPLLSILSKRELIWEMAMRDLKGLNKGALLGWFWLVLNPLIQTAAYVLIVSFVFNRRGSDGGPLDYALYVLSGMVPWQIMMRSLSEAPALIRTRMDLVKQVIYPIETLPITSLVVSAFGSLVSLAIFVAVAVPTGNLAWTAVLLPLPFALLLLLILGISWVFMFAGVLLKDLREMVTIALALLVYLSPVVVRESMVSPTVYRLILCNPLAHVVICFRDVLGGEYHPLSWLVFVAMVVVAMVGGGWILKRAKLVINEYI